jgi:hypothetical protein
LEEHPTLGVHGNPNDAAVNVRIADVVDRSHPADGFFLGSAAGRVEPPEGRMVFRGPDLHHREDCVTAAPGRHARGVADVPQRRLNGGT